MADDLVLVGINPATRKCELTSIDEPDAWNECRDMGLIPIRVQVRVARQLFGRVVPCLDALLPVPEGARRVFVHVHAPQLADGLFATLVADALRKMADLEERTGGTEEVRDGLWLNEGPSLLHVATHWPLEDV